jgi:hypothetical protein
MRVRERGPRGMQRQIRGKLAWRGDVAFTNSRSLDDPLIGRVNGTSELIVANDARRQITTAAEDN